MKARKMVPAVTIQSRAVMVQAQLPTKRTAPAGALITPCARFRAVAWTIIGIIAAHTPMQYRHRMWMS